MAEIINLRSDSGTVCSGLTSPRSLGEAQSSVQTQLLSNGVLHSWTIEQPSKIIEAGEWEVVLRVEAGGPNQAQAQVQCRVERRNSECSVQETLINDTLGVGTSGVSDITYSASLGEVEFNDGDRLVVLVNRTNSTNRTATLRFAGNSPDNSRLVHPESIGIEEPGEVVLSSHEISLEHNPLEIIGDELTDGLVLLDTHRIEIVNHSLNLLVDGPTYADAGARGTYDDMFGGATYDTFAIFDIEPPAGHYIERRESGVWRPKGLKQRINGEWVSVGIERVDN